MGDVRNDEQAKVINAILETEDAQDFAVLGLGVLATRLKEFAGEVPAVVELQIATVTQYLDMLTAQSELSAEEQAYQTGITHGALIAIWKHLELLGYIANVNDGQMPMVIKKKKKEK